MPGFLKEARIHPLPFLTSIKRYNAKKLRADLIAGLTVAVITLPQSIAYALIAGVHPKYGLYASIIPTIISAFFRSSKHVILGPTNSASMVLASTLSSIAVGGVIIQSMPEQDKMALVFLLSFLAGVIQLIFGLVNAGNLVNFVSFSVTIGFTAGAGILIAFNQLKNFLGISVGAGSHFIFSTYEVLSHINETNLISLSLGLFTIALILFLKRFAPKIPGPLVSIIACGLLAYFFDLPEFGVKMVGDIPRTAISFSRFHFNLEIFKALAPSALAFAILGVIEAFSISKAISNLNGEKANENQDFFAQGLANIAGAFFSSIPVSGSFTRTMTNFNAGARTRFAGAFSGLIVLFALVFFSSLAKYIPIPSLAGMIIIIAYSMVSLEDIAFAYNAARADRIVVVGTFLSALILELQDAIFVGVFLSLILFLRKISHPQIIKVLPRPTDKKLVPYDISGSRCSQLKIFQVDGSLFFGAAAEMERKLRDFNTDKVNALIVRLKGVRMIDATGAYALKKFLNDCKKNNTRVIFAGVRSAVRKTLERSGLIKEIGEENITPDTSVALSLAFKKYLDNSICAACENRLFKECAAMNAAGREKK